MMSWLRKVTYMGEMRFLQNIRRKIIKVKLALEQVMKAH
jgi:hypothetical protein